MCSGLISLDVDTCVLYDENNAEAGVLVFDIPAMGKIIGQLQRREVVFFQQTDTQLVTGICHTFRQKELAGFKVGGNVASENIVLIAENGVNFEETSEGIKINLYGEEHIYPDTVKSINGVKRDHYWWASHPDSALRVVTEDQGILLGTKKGLS